MNQTFLISYDLRAPETASDYQRVVDYIKSYSYWCKPLKSQWIVISATKTGKDIINDLQKLTDNNDKLLVINISGDNWWSFGLDEQVADWMQKNI